MSTPVTMPMSGDLGRAGDFRDVSEYVTAVRRHLDDLERDELEELTGGLEADLADALLNQEVAPVVMFGAPKAYADELRSAAGLPPRSTAGRRSGLTGRPHLAPRLSELAPRLREARDQALTPLVTQAWWPDVREFFVTLRPAWWLLRAYIAYQWIDQSLTGADQLLPYGVVSGLGLALLIVGSVELGRRDWAARGRWPQQLIRTGNVFAVFLIVSAVGMLGPDLDTYTRAGSDTGYSESSVAPPSVGLVNGGYQVVNVFPYDQDGRPLTDVQLFDDRGRPLAPSADTYTGRNSERVRLVPAVTADGDRGFNVFPLREQVIEPGYDPGTGEPITGAPLGVLRPAVRPDPTQQPVIPLPVPAAGDPESATSATSSP